MGRIFAKVLSFFRTAAQDYSDDTRLSSEARKLLRTYKKLFADLSERNQGNHALETTRRAAGTEKAATSTSSQNVQAADAEGERFSIKDGKVIIDTDQRIFDGVDRKDYGRTVRTYMRAHFRGKSVSDTIFTRIGEREYTASKYTQGMYSSDDGLFEAKMQASTELDNIVSIGRFIGHEDAKHPHSYNGNGYDRYEVIFNLDGQDFRGEMLIAIDENDRHTFYDIVNIKRSATDRAADIADRGGSASVEKQHISQSTNAEALIRTPEARSSMDTVPMNSIPDSGGNVNTNSEKNFGSRGGYSETVARDAGTEKAATSMNSQNVQAADGNTVENRATNDAGGDVRYALRYDDAIDKLENGTLDTTQNTHLRVLEHTPRIYIDKAGANDHEIVMSWDVAYLAMNKNGAIQGNYHGLGSEIMKALPAALEDPLYIVKQKNGRIAAVTKIVVKGKRAVFASIELETYQTTIQEGENEAKKYNLVVTVTDAKPNYLQNTLFGGEIVHNKKSEDPAHFILRLKSLEKAMPTYDLTGSSDKSITENAEKSNPFGKKIFDQRLMPSENGGERYALSDTDNNEKSLANYTEEQYNSFGWARAAGALTSTELDDLYAKIQGRSTLRTFKRSSQGEAIIEVNGKPRTTLDTDNVFVFVKGTKNNFAISRVVRFDVNTETEMEILREKLYERGTCSDSYLAIYREKGLTREYRAEDFESFAEYSEERAERGAENRETSRGAYSDSRGRAKYRSGYSLKVGDDGEIIERFALKQDKDPSAILADLADGMDPREAATFDVQKILDKGAPTVGSRTVGELKRTIAEHSHYKVYSRKNALEVISQTPGIRELSGKSRAELTDLLWQGLNSCEDKAARQTFAHDMASYLVSTMVAEAKTENPAVAEAKERLSYLGGYVGRLTFNRAQLSEIQSIADKAGARRILGRWGNKSRSGVSPVPMDVFVVDIAREMPGADYLEGMHPADALMELTDLLWQGLNSLWYVLLATGI